MSFLFMARDHSDRERLFVCSHAKDNRLAAEKLIDQEVRDIMDDRGANQPPAGSNPGPIPAQSRPNPGPIPAQ